MDKQITVLLPSGVSLEMVLVPAGHFIMGSEAEAAGPGEKPEHIVKITQPFYIGKFPVTQGQWEAVIGYNPSRFIGAQRPVEYVSWKEIVKGKQDKDGSPAFLDSLNTHFRQSGDPLVSTHRFRLPTEAEWEYAAKGGNTYPKEELEGKKAKEKYTTYAGGDRLDACGWYDGDNNAETRPVGLKAPNELGLYDMSGNVLEWCYDWFDGKVYEGQKGVVTKDPVGSDSGVVRMMRGGGYWSDAVGCRVSYRDYDHPAMRGGIIGFRLVLSPSYGSGASG